MKYENYFIRNINSILGKLKSFQIIRLRKRKKERKKVKSEGERIWEKEHEKAQR